MKINTIFTILLLSLILFSCENTNEDVFNGAFNKGELGTTSISSISTILDTTAIVNCLITYKGKGYLLARGVCWGITETSTIDSSHITVTDTGQVALKLPGLKPGTLYYVRPYMTNKTGTSYGDMVSFTTKNKPTVLTLEPTNLTSTTVTLGGNVTADGGDSVTVRGICWDTASNPTIALTTKTVNGSDKGTFNADITNLTLGTIYYARAYATNSYGTVYGNEITFTTQNLPTISTIDVTNITTVTATSGGNITGDGGSIVIARGICWGAAQNPTIELTTKTNEGIGIGSFSSTMVSLQLGTTYYVRAYATNSVGTVYGQNISFKTTSFAATVSTNSISNITYTTATCGGNITTDGGASVTARGVCWSSTSFAPTIELNDKTIDGSGSGAYSSSITGLIGGTTYYVRAYATNSNGTSYGNYLSFTTSGVKDIDGNVYKTVTIGTQVWMAENLKTTHYRNGAAITNVTDNSIWYSLSSGAQCTYNNDALNGNKFGRLYNGYAVTDTRNIAPTGWHVPSDAEWTILENYLIANGYNYDGTTSGNKIAKSLAATTYWGNSSTEGSVAYNKGTNNSTGFSFLPSGCRWQSPSLVSEFSAILEYGYEWTSTQNGADLYYRTLAYTYIYLERSSGTKFYGFPVRCIKD
jgi:uncharacterized protein (TIGR02145 family)